MEKVKYHLSEKGRPNKCDASVRACPLGSVKHYDSKDEARADYEITMREATFKPVSRSKHRLTPFDAEEIVRSKTASSYDKEVKLAGGFRFLKAAHPELDFRKAAGGELVVTGTALNVEQYIARAGQKKEDVSLGHSRMRGLVKGGRSTMPSASVTPPLVDEVMPAVEFSETLAEEVELEDVAIDNDWDSVKCDDCGAALSHCLCDTCSYCGGTEGDHEEDCRMLERPPTGYSWDQTSRQDW